MKKVVNFLDKKIEVLERYKEFKIMLDLEKDLDMSISKFTKKLKKEIEEQLDEQFLTHYLGPIAIKVYTGLPREELKPLQGIISSSVASFLVADRTSFKTEKILGIITFKDFEKIELPFVSLMDLLNHPLKNEVFNIGLYDKDKLLYKSLVNW